MWRRKRKTSDKPHPGRGTPRSLDGHTALRTVTASACNALIVQSGRDLIQAFQAREADGENHGGSCAVRQIDGLRPIAALATGYAASGLRGSALVSSLDGIHDALHAAAGKRLPFVLQLTCRALKRQTEALAAGHDEYYGAGGAGLFQFFAADVQEVTDFALIAHRIAELSLTPGICAQDFLGTSHSVQDLFLPEPELLQTYLGRPDDTIATPTAAQACLFGEERRRIPRLLDRDHPAGIGGAQDFESYFKAIAGQRPFFVSHLNELIEQAFVEFAELTGRRYHPVNTHAVEDADYLLVAQGAVIDGLQAVADYLRAEEKLRVGVLNLSVYRPFPGALLTRLLKGKKAVTVLERTDQPLAGDLPLIREIRGAIDRAGENGAAGKDDPPHPDYDSYGRADDRPQLFSGIYGVGGPLPRFAELVAVVRNMLPGGAARRTFYVASDFGQRSQRFPHLQTLEQKLLRSYPALAELSIEPATTVSPPRASARSMQLCSISMQGGLFAGNLFARALGDVLQGSVRTFPRGSLAGGLQATVLTMLHAETQADLEIEPDLVDAVLVASDDLLEKAATLSAAKRGASLLLASTRGPEAVWESLSRRAVQWIRELDLRLVVVDTRALVAARSATSSYVDQLVIWALLGAYARTGGVSAESEPLVDALRVSLESFFGAAHHLVGQVIDAFGAGAEQAEELEWKPLERDETALAMERTPPWTLKNLRPEQDSVFDATRFWHSVGYLYETGQARETLVDPYVATGVIPAGSSAFRDMTPYRVQLPRWLPENCTGCGLCWTHCPDTALPPSLGSVTSVLNAAMTACEEGGTTLIQTRRIAGHLATQTRRLIKRDDLHQYRTMGPLFSAAFSELLDKLGSEGSQRETLEGEFRELRAALEDFPFARTEQFFGKTAGNSPDQDELLTIAVNPSSCKGCGLCLEVCPEQAFAWGPQDAESLAGCRRNWEFQRGLPHSSPASLAAHIDESEPDTQVNRLLATSVYQSLVGGDGAVPGNGIKTAVHLLTATIESIMQPRFEAHVDRLSGLIGRIEDKIQGRVAEAVRINDFEQFGERLSRLEGKPIGGDDLARVAGVGGGPAGIDQAQLERLSRLLAQLKEQRRRYLEGGGGAGRARLVMTIEPGAAALWSGSYPDNPHPYPWICQLAGDAPALAEAVFEGVTQQLAEEFGACRLAALELDDRYVPGETRARHGSLSFEDFTRDERELVPPVIVLGQTGLTHWDDIARLFGSGHPIQVVMLNCGVPGTGGAGETRRLSQTEPAFIALGHADVLVLQSSIGNPGHLIQGVAAALEQNCPALLHLYATDPQVAGVAPRKTAQQARRAYQSRAFPLFRRDPHGDQTGLSLAGNPEPDRDWACFPRTVEDASGAASTMTTPLTAADWAIGEERFRGHFRIVSTGHLGDHMKHLAEYLDLPAGERAGLDPYIDVIDADGKRQIAIVSGAMAAMAEGRAGLWRRLQAIAAGGPVEEIGTEPAVTPEPAPATASASPARDEITAHQELTERLLWLCGFSGDPGFYGQSLGSFLDEQTGEKTDAGESDDSAAAP